MKQSFMAYENNSDEFRIGNAAIKNGYEVISIEGKLEISKDKVGLEAALKLKRVVDAAIDALKRDRNLPEHICESRV